MAVEITDGKSEPQHPEWPKDGEHFWSPWAWAKGLPNPEQSRYCIHPQCFAVQTRPGPRA